MPHLTLNFSQMAEHIGPVIQVYVGLGESQLAALRAQGVPPPPEILVRALIDTGAFCSAVDPNVVSPLKLVPFTQGQMRSPTTGAVSLIRDVYAISVWIQHEQAQYEFSRYFPVFLVDFSTQGVDMILGRDVLEHCLFVYDGTNKIFSLAF